MTRLTHDMRRAAVTTMTETLAEPLVAKAASELGAAIVIHLRRMVPEEVMAMTNNSADFLLFGDSIRLCNGHDCDISGFPVSQVTRNCYDIEELLKAYPQLVVQLEPLTAAFDQALEARGRLRNEARRLFNQYHTLEALVADWPESEKWFVAKPVKQLPAVRCDTVKSLVESFKNGIVPEEKQ